MIRLKMKTKYSEFELEFECIEDASQFMINYLNWETQFVSVEITKE